VPELLVAEGRYGVRPGETLAAARAELEEALATAAAADPWLRDNPPVVEWFEGQFAPAETPTEHPFVRVLSEVHQSAAGRAPLTHGVTYGSDLRLFTNDAAMAAVLYGPGDVRLAHTVDERVPLDEVVQAATVVAQLILRWGGAA
jgi:acetylornithine deacetylase